MKKIISLILVLVLVMALSACGEVEITMQEISDANQTEALFKNHQSVYIQEKMDGELWSEVYLTNDDAFMHIPDEEYPMMEFMTDDVCYYNDAGTRLLFLFITPDGAGDFASDRAERNASTALSAVTEGNIIESVSKKDGRITVKASLEQDVLAAEKEEFGITSAKFEYVLDAKTYEILSIISDYTYEDGTVYNLVTEVTYDAEVPETAKEFLAYRDQTENLRNVTVVSNPGTEKEESKSIQAPKGLVMGFQFDEDLEYAVEFYTDAACTQSYDPFANIDSDLTIYVKWTE